MMSIRIPINFIEPNEIKEREEKVEENEVGF